MKFKCMNLSVQLLSWIVSALVNMPGAGLPEGDLGRDISPEEEFPLRTLASLGSPRRVQGNRAPFGRGREKNGPEVPGEMSFGNTGKQ